MDHLIDSREIVKEVFEELDMGPIELEGIHGMPMIPVEEYPKYKEQLLVLHRHIKEVTLREKKRRELESHDKGIS